MPALRRLPRQPVDQIDVEVGEADPSGEVEGAQVQGEVEAPVDLAQLLVYQGLDAQAQPSEAEFARAFGGVDASALFREEFEALEAEGCVTLATACPVATGGPPVAPKRAGGPPAATAVIRLTARGVRHADVVGQLFFSGRVRRLMDTYEYDS